MEARAIMEEVQGILDETTTKKPVEESALIEGKDPADVAYAMFKNHASMKAHLAKGLDEMDKVWARSFSEIERGKRWGGAAIAAVDHLKHDAPPLEALRQLRTLVDGVINRVNEVHREARRGAGSMDMDKKSLRMSEEEGKIDLLADDIDIDEAYADIGRDAPYVGSDNADASRGLGDNSPYVVKTAKMRVSQKAVEIVKKGVEKSRAAGSQDLTVVGTGKDFVMVSGEAGKLDVFARKVAARSSKPTIVSTAFGAGGLLAKENKDDPCDLVIEFSEDIFDDLTEGDVLRAAFCEATYYQSGKDLYVDTAYINAVKNVKGFTLSHMGFGEFTLKDSKGGEIEFDRMRGKEFPGQSGRSHKVYDNKSGSLIKKMMAAMKSKAKASKAESLESYESELKRLDEAVKFIGGVGFGSESKKPEHQAKKGDPKTIAAMRKIAREHQAKEIDGVMVDASTANLVIQIYDKLNPANKAKFANMKVGPMGKMAWKIASK